MVVIRPTKRLAVLLGLGLGSQEAPPEPTGLLGDWYGNWLPTRTVGPLVVLMNAPTRLAVLSRARTPGLLVRDFRDHAARLFRTLGVPKEAAHAEVRTFYPVYFRKTVERTLVGSLNEICHFVAMDDESGRLAEAEGIVDAENRLSEFVHLKLPETHPARAVRVRLGGVDPRLH